MNLTVTDLRLVQTKVNMFPYLSDATRWALPDFWEEINESGGDCEDYAVAKMQRLKAMGLPASAMRFATAFVEPSAAGDKRDRYHGVLLVDLNDQTYVLDNRYPLPMEYDLLPYEWHKFQVPGTQNWEWAKDADRSIK